ncbi:hypothetical protein GDO86_000949 [Hymenochirus boettgeri]|uniref:Ribosomal protein eL8/eL30/eS12/Gadd45 domain-containing protein n=1 Tax=Hymenochirus boettgeri TaxID=247094 RepID=A0A8T2KDQ2_9PIPI|nr:hypothetical protein GDO86_000949 [Hymenochirus boettgeri]
MQPVRCALEEVLMAALKLNSLTVGVYESAKMMNVDPERVILCLLAADPEHEDDVALKIHFTLIKAFCCNNDINIVQVSGLKRLSEIISGQTEPRSESNDLHCILVSDLLTDSWKCSSWDKITNLCAEHRSRNQLVPFISLTER